MHVYQFEVECVGMPREKDGGRESESEIENSGCGGNRVLSICMLYPGQLQSHTHATIIKCHHQYHHRERNEHCGIFLDEGAHHPHSDPFCSIRSSRVPCTKVYPAEAAGPLVHRGIPTKRVTNLEEAKQSTTKCNTYPQVARPLSSIAFLASLCFCVRWFGLASTVSMTWGVCWYHTLACG